MPYSWLRRHAQDAFVEQNWAGSQGNSAWVAYFLQCSQSQSRIYGSECSDSQTFWGEGQLERLRRDIRRVFFCTDTCLIYLKDLIRCEMDRLNYTGIYLRKAFDAVNRDDLL